MKRIPFTKMHGIQNDYIYINSLELVIDNPKELAIAISNRHTGVGADGLILIKASEPADFKMEIYNPDGSQAEMCGNGIRCFSKYVYDNKLTKKDVLKIETLAGILEAKLRIKNNKITDVTIDMGEPALERSEIPMEGGSGQVINEVLELDDMTKFEICAVSMGNPHVINFVEDLYNFPVQKYGPIIENHALFPGRTNVEFVEIISESEVKQRTWERGAGETMACGTGASAVTVAGVLSKKLASKVLVHLTGGDLNIKWDQKTNHVFMTGPAEEVFKGEWIV